jgi:hypothetical protein
MKRKTKTHHANWRGFALTIRWTPAWYEDDDGSGDVAHLEIKSDDGAALPISETGYQSYFTAPAEVEEFGGPVAYALAWLVQDAQLPLWKKRETAVRQLSLF